MTIPHFNTNNRAIGKEHGRIHRTDDPKQFIRTYMVIEEIDLNRVESDLAEYQELKDLYDLLTD